MVKVVSSKIHLSKKLKVILAVTGLLILGIFYLLSPVLIGGLETVQLRKVFAEQRSLLEQPIASIGVNGSPSYHFQCFDDVHSHWQTAAICQAFDNYPYNSGLISEPIKQNNQSSIPKFEKILQQNGWVNDRPNDPYASFSGAINYAQQSEGQSGEVPMHKNIGDISCNLKIDFGTFSINVNEFSCGQTIKFFMPHLTKWQAPGP